MHIDLLYGKLKRWKVNPDKEAERYAVTKKGSRKKVTQPHLEVIEFVSGGGGGGELLAASWQLVRGLEWVSEATLNFSMQLC